MSWSEIKKSVNSDLGKPLNEFMQELSDEEIELLNNIISKLDNTTYGLSALKTILDTINTNAAYAKTNNTLLNNTTYGLSALKTLINKINTTVNANKQSYSNVSIINAARYADVTVTGKGKATLFNSSSGSSITIEIDGVSVPRIPVGCYNPSSGTGYSWANTPSFTFEKSFVIPAVGADTTVKALIQTV